MNFCSNFPKFLYFDHIFFSIDQKELSNLVKRKYSNWSIYLNLAMFQSIIYERNKMISKFWSIAILSLNFSLVWGKVQMTRKLQFALWYFMQTISHATSFADADAFILNNACNQIVAWIFHDTKNIYYIQIYEVDPISLKLSFDCIRLTEKYLHFLHISSKFKKKKWKEKKICGGIRLNQKAFSAVDFNYSPNM